ncbi:LysE family translocator [Streptomyces sp. A7024]|uniref:LysE family translocator n=1 Tax=Streptomyces coryli TaxID=1128680 RepID=A0A6G4UCX3_9ACTN|nr:LysE family translocator [Streptomyces coryli]NGN69051.1 LysE family translocator [Streptomyces coryli]
MDTRLLLLFLGVDVLLILTPGPDWMYIVARALRQGREAGLYAVAGMATAYTAHTLLAAVGLAAAFAALPGALVALRYVGAAYLVFLAAGLLLSLRQRRGDRRQRLDRAVAEASPAKVLRQSLLTALLNPKGLLLYLALIPQFVSPEAALPLGAQTAVLGLLHVLCCSAGYVLVALAAARAGTALGRSPRARRGIGVVSAVLLLGVAGVTAGVH